MSDTSQSAGNFRADQYWMILINPAACTCHIYFGQHGLTVLSHGESVTAPLRSYSTCLESSTVIIAAMPVAISAHLHFVPNTVAPIVPNTEPSVDLPRPKNIHSSRVVWPNIETHNVLIHGFRKICRLGDPRPWTCSIT